MLVTRPQIIYIEFADTFHEKILQNPSDAINHKLYLAWAFYVLKQGSKQEVDSLVKGMGSGELPPSLKLSKIILRS